MTFLRSSSSPRTSTEILRVMSPRAIAVATAEMSRTWLVRFDAIWLTLSVSSFQVPRTPSTDAWPPSSGHVAARDLGGDGRDVAHLVGQVRRHLVDVVGQLLPGAANAFDRRLATELGSCRRARSRWRRPRCRAPGWSGSTPSG